MNIRLFFLLLLPFLIGSCKQRSSEPTTEVDPAIAEQFGDFAEFYDRFHTDSLYQVAHVRFPLSGLPSNADSATLARNDFYWQQEDWKMHRRFDFVYGDFNQKLTPMGEDLIVEQIIHESGQYAMQRRFTRWDGEWYLTYYIGLNSYQPNNTGIDIQQLMVNGLGIRECLGARGLSLHSGAC